MGFQTSHLLGFWLCALRAFPLVMGGTLDSAGICLYFSVLSWLQQLTLVYCNFQYFLSYYIICLGYPLKQFFRSIQHQKKLPFDFDKIDNLPADYPPFYPLEDYMFPIFHKIKCSFTWVPAQIIRLLSRDIWIAHQPRTMY